MTKLYAEISKMEQQDDGTIKVWGYASSESVDSDGETITAEAMKAAIPDYMKFGAVREMHSKIAAGTAIEINVEDDGRTFFGAHVVDPVAVKKVQTGVYKGFSIGGSVTARDELNKSVIKGVKLTEISLVDRPANPDAVFTCFKADKGADAADGGQSDEHLEQAGAAPDVQPDAAQAAAQADDNQAESDSPAEKAAKMAADALAKSEEAIKAAQPDAIEKGASISNIESISGVLRCLRWFIKDCEFDVEYNELPEAVVTSAKAAASSLADALQILADYHVAEIKDDAAKSDQSNNLSKAAVSDELAKMQAERDSALAALAALKAQPSPAKAAAMAISKAADTGADVLDGFVPITKSDGTLDDVATLVKAAQSGRLK